MARNEGKLRVARHAKERAEKRYELALRGCETGLNKREHVVYCAEKVEFWEQRVEELEDQR